MDDEHLEQWFRDLVKQQQRAGRQQDVVTLPDTDLTYRLDVTDWKVIPLFTDPGDFKPQHEQFRKVARYFPFPKGGGYAMYPCETEYPPQQLGGAQCR